MEEVKIPRLPGSYGRSKAIQNQSTIPPDSFEKDEPVKDKPPKWSLGILNDKGTDEVPGRSNAASDVALIHDCCLQARFCSCQKSRSETSPWFLRNAPARTSASSLPSPYPPASESNAHLGPQPGPYRSSSHRSVVERAKEDCKWTNHTGNPSRRNH